MLVNYRMSPIGFRTSFLIYSNSNNSMKCYWYMATGYKFDRLYEYQDDVYNRFLFILFVIRKFVNDEKMTLLELRTTSKVS